jgi:NAD(P)-dependent dehydrogenase (short-subunit alcohol dehydrogenase family)
MKLNDKVAVITGGNSGIGLAIAKRYQREGAKLVVFGRNADTLALAASELGDEALVVKGDVTKVADLERLYSQTVARFGKIDVLVANAGVARPTPLGDTAESTFDLISDINFKGAYFTIQSALPHLAEKASLLITGSAVAYKSMPTLAAYAATKAAVRSLVRTFAAELAPRGVRVNVLSPGPIETPIYGKLGISAEEVNGFAEQILSQVPLNRFGSGDEMAKAAVFLGSDDSSYVTGSDLVADGGFAA